MNESVVIRIKQARIDLLKEENAELQRRLVRSEALVRVLRARYERQEEKKHEVVAVGEEEQVRGAA